MKFRISYSECIHGKFVLGKINLVMAFQVNCPGCFIHGFPLMKELKTYYGTNLSCFALSTAFEDFKLNTIDNTRLLFTTGDLVGETLKAHTAGLLTWDAGTVTFPVLIDDVVDRSQLLQQQFIDSIIQNYVDEGTADTDQEYLRITLRNYFGQMPKCGLTFASNLMRGTPSFFLFTDSMEIIDHWFGHANSYVVKQKLDILIEKQ